MNTKISNINNNFHYDCQPNYENPSTPTETLLLELSKEDRTLISEEGLHCENEIVVSLAYSRLPLRLHLQLQNCQKAVQELHLLYCISGRYFHMDLLTFLGTYIVHSFFLPQKLSDFNCYGFPQNYNSEMLRRVDFPQFQKMKYLILKCLCFSVMISFCWWVLVQWNQQKYR